MMRTAAMVLAAAGLALADVAPKDDRTDCRRMGQISAVVADGLWLPSPGGRYVAYYQENDIKILNAATGKEIGTLQGNGDGGIQDGGWCANGRLLATAGYDAVVKVWDVQTLKEVASISAHAGYT